MTHWDKERWLNKHGLIGTQRKSSISAAVMIWAPNGSPHNSVHSIAIMGDDDETVDNLYEAIKDKLFYRCNYGSVRKRGRALG